MKVVFHINEQVGCLEVLPSSSNQVKTKTGIDAEENKSRCLCRSLLWLIKFRRGKMTGRAR